MIDFSDPDSLLPGLRPASWRGVPFWVIDASHRVGRRIQTTLYPGLDLKTHDDVGPLDGPIRISGLVIGDDYVRQAEALGAAFRQAGVGTFMHPWRGAIRCVLLRPAEISFATGELRVARVEAEFDPTSPDGPAVLGAAGIGLSSLVGLVASAYGLSAGAGALVQAVLSASPMALVVATRAAAAIGNALAIASAAAASVPRSADLLPRLDAMRRLQALATDTRDAAALAQVVVSVPSILAGAYRPQPEPGVGASTEAPAAAPPADVRAGTDLLLSIAANVALRSSDTGGTDLPGRPPVSDAERIIYVAAEAAMLAQAVSLVADIPFDSQREAYSWQGRTDAALAAAGGRAALLASAAPAGVSRLWEAIEGTRARLSVDISDVIGRLPAIDRIEPPRASGWLLAQHIAGDEPAAIVPMLLDIRRRNRLRHPAILGAGPLEVLRSEAAA